MSSLWIIIKKVVQLFWCQHGSYLPNTTSMARGKY
jgi:hypothetical protein